MTRTKPGNSVGESEPRLPMDIKHIKNLIGLMVENDLNRLELREGDAHILLRRSHQTAVTPPAAAPPNPPPAVATDAAGPAPSASTTASATAENELLIRSPMVGTFYPTADPDTPPFVTVGSEIDADTIVCLVEAMKVFNEIKAEVAGQITKVLVKNAEAVEFDQPLFAVRPA